MTYLIGLGNPGSEYENTRHNVGRDFVDYVANKNDFPDFKFDPKLKAWRSAGVLDGKKITLLKPDTFMNNSGVTLKGLTLSAKQIESVVVAYDDMDLGLGNLKISFNRGSGGHNGLASIIKAAKTEKFARFRFGVSPTNAKGVAKKPIGEDKVLKFILSAPKPDDRKILTKTFKTAMEALAVFANDGLQKAMTDFN